MYHIDLELPEEKHDEILTLVAMCGFKDTRELHNTALTIFQLIVREIVEGRPIASIDEANKKYKKLVMGFMKNVNPDIDLS